VALAAKYGTAYLWLERYLVVLAAMIANYLESFRHLLTGGRLFRAALCATLRRHHVPLVEHFLFLFREEKRLLALDTNSFHVRHLDSPYCISGE
jgi:hypothetical protein